MLVSVIVPVFNGARFLAATLDSVFAQDYRPLEVIVIDDGSTDATPDILAARPDVIALRQPNRGAAAARNAGIARAHGEFIAFLDSDDLWRPGKLTKQMAIFEKSPEIELCVGKFRNFLEPGCTRPQWLPARMFEQELPGMVPSAVVVRRSAFDRIGRFDERLRRGEDLDWFSRAIDDGMKFAAVGELLFDRRIHDGNLTADLEACIRAILLVARRAIMRRRTEAAAAARRN